MGQWGCCGVAALNGQRGGVPKQPHSSPGYPTCRAVCAECDRVGRASPDVVQVGIIRICNWRVNDDARGLVHGNERKDRAPGVVVCEGRIDRGVPVKVSRAGQARAGQAKATTGLLGEGGSGLEDAPFHQHEDAVAQKVKLHVYGNKIDRRRFFLLSRQHIDLPEPLSSITGHKEGARTSDGGALVPGNMVKQTSAGLGEG